MALSEERSFLSAANDLFSWMHENSILSDEDVGPPASEAELALLDEIYNYRIPLELKLFYKIHNGQMGRSNGIFAGYHFMSTDDIVDAQALASDLHNDATMDLHSASLVPGEILPISSHPERISFAHGGGGNYLAIDLKPGDTGRIGQVINCGRDESPMQVIAPSFYVFIVKYYQVVSEGKIRPVLDEDLGMRLEGSPYDNLIQLLTLD